jgi:hypothetical protein
MNRAVLIIALVLLGRPAFAQDIDLGLAGDAGGLLNIPAPAGNRGAPARGGTPAPRGAAPTAAPVDRLVRLRQLMASATLPLSKEQETALNALLNAEIPAMRRTLQSRIAELQRARGAVAPPTPAAPNLPSMDELAPEIIRLNDQLLGKIAEAPALAPEQQALIRKVYKDQVKSRGGLDAIRLTLEDAGAPFSPEQIAQIQPLFDEQNQSRAQVIRESAGQPVDKTKLDQLQRDTLAKVLKLLTTAQRAAILAGTSKPAQ